MTLLSTQVGHAAFAAEGDHEDITALLIEIIKERPGKGMATHLGEFKRRVVLDSHEGYLRDALNRAFSLRYPSALRAVSPKSDRQEVREKTEQAKTAIVGRLLDLVTANGKKLRDCTGAECVQMGGFYIAVGKRVGADNMVGDRLSNAQLSRLLHKNTNG